MQPGSIRHLFRLKRACKTEANLKYVLHTKRFSSCFAALFFCFASVLEGTRKGVEDEKSEQKQWSN